MSKVKTSISVIAYDDGTFTASVAHEGEEATSEPQESNSGALEDAVMAHPAAAAVCDLLQWETPE